MECIKRTEVKPSGAEGSDQNLEDVLMRIKVCKDDQIGIKGNCKI